MSFVASHARASATFENIDRVERALGSLLVLEVRKNVSAFSQVLLNTRNHRFAFFRCVVWVAIAVIGEIGRQPVGSVALFGFGNAQGRVSFAERLPCSVLVPRSMSKLERGPTSAREDFQKFRKNSLTRLEVGGQLKKDRAEPLNAFQ